MRSALRCCCHPPALFWAAAFETDGTVSRRSFFRAQREPARRRRTAGTPGGRPDQGAGRGAGPVIDGEEFGVARDDPPANENTPRLNDKR